MTHDLKTWPEPFAAVLAGRKVHEVRKNDRGFAVGDELLLREWNPYDERTVACWRGAYTGRWIRAEVTYITPGGAFGLPLELCVMSIVVTARASRSDGKQDLA